MEVISYIIIGLFSGVIILALAWFFVSKMSKTQGSDNSLLLIQRELQELSRLVDEKIGESSKFMQESIKHQYGESQKLIREITEELTSVKETGRQMVGFADELKSLQDVLKNPKQRGVLGEYYLETLLKNVLPPGSYQMQYKLGQDEKTGKDLIVDAVVFVRDKIIPVDSKFSLENYNRLVSEKDATEREKLEKAFKADLKNRIDETAKYVRPSEGTLDFAFMFIPHEAIYYDLLVASVGAVKVNTRDLIEYAFKDKKVIIVSPTSFLAYLQTVLQGLKALQIEESAKEIRKRVEELGRHLSSYDDFMKRIGNSLGTTVNHYNSAYREFKKIDKDVLRITGQNGEIEALSLDKPSVEE